MRQPEVLTQTPPQFSEGFRQALAAFGQGLQFPLFLAQAAERLRSFDDCISLTSINTVYPTLTILGHVGQLGVHG